MNRLLTTTEVAEILRVSPRTVRRLMASGQLRAIRVGRLPRITEAEVEAFCAASFRGAA